MLFGPTWQGTISSVSEDDGQPPELKLTLLTWRSDYDQPAYPASLPRAGDKYWLVSDSVFKHLTGDDGG